jgi:hypothetical protein
LSTRAVAFLGANFVCAHAGDEINRITNTSFFIDFSHETCAIPVSIEPDRPGDVYRRNLASRRKKAAEPRGPVFGSKNRFAARRGSQSAFAGRWKSLRIQPSAGMFLASTDSGRSRFFHSILQKHHEHPE